MLISDIAIRRPVFTTMVIGALLVFGWVSFRNLGIDLFPRVEFPIITVLTVLPGADPETIESTVTDPIEEAVNTIAGIKHLRSNSVDSVSQVAIEFELEKNVDIAFQEVQARVNSIRSNLPQDIDEPVIEKMDVDAAPILSVIVSGDLSIKALSHLADKTVKERLQRVQNVGSVKLVGKRDRKIWLWLDPLKLKQHELSVSDVRAALAREHVESPGGRVETGPLELAVKTKAEFTGAAEFNRMVVASRHGGTIRLEDIGHAEDGLEEMRSAADLDGTPSLALLVRRQSGTNTVRVAEDVKAEVERLKRELAPQGVRLELAQDSSLFIERSVDEVKRHLLLGGALAVAVVLLFLLNVRSAFISALVLPTSVISTFMMMNALGFTLNMMTLLGLTLAIGLLIDDSIVVQENTMRHVQAGKPPRFAAQFATSEIGLAVLATTLCVVAVFVPVAYTRGIVGRFFFSFALTVAFAVLVSMFVSFTLDPMLSSRLLRRQTHLNPVFRFLEASFQQIERAYAFLLRWVLAHRVATLAAAVAVLIGSLSLTGFLRKEFMPTEDQSEFNVMVRAPLGSSVTRTLGILDGIRPKLKALPEVDYVFSTVGADELQKVNQGQMYVKLKDKRARTRTQLQVMQSVREMLKDTPDAIVSVQIVPHFSGGGMRWAEVQYDLRGRDFEVLNQQAAQLTAYMKSAGGYVDVDTSFETGKPETDILVNRDRAAALGISPRNIGDVVRAGIGGLDVGKFKAEGDRYDIAVRYLESFRDKPELIDLVGLPAPGGNLVELRNVARVVNTKTAVEIDRYNRQREVIVLANLQGKVLGQAAQEIDGFMAKHPLPPGYSTGWTGMAEAMNESFGYLIFTMVLSVIVVYMVLAAQFESFVHPFTIMVSLPLSICGAFGALLIFNMTLAIFTMIAFIFLLGLVTKNAILLIDYTNTLRSRDGLPREAALLRAGPVRLRPILMTTFAMIFGMLPIALGTGAGSESRQPMAVAIIGGLVSSTLLTLLVVPAVYSLLDQAAVALKVKFFPQGEIQVDEPEVQAK